MLFHMFQSHKARRDFGGSYFMEIQYCRLPQGTKLKKIVSVEAISHWKNDSIYIFGDDIEVFYKHYGNIFTDGVYNNEERGPVDLCGINFYSREQSTLIIDRINTKTPPDYQVLLNWLRSGEHYIGFYILGL